MYSYFASLLLNKLRDYGTGKWINGDPACVHIPHKLKTKKQGNTAFNENRPSRDKTLLAGTYTKECTLCGAVWHDEQIGLEQTPRQYIESLLEVFRECYRVLADDGTCWVNIGDSYNSNPGNGRGLKSTLQGGKPHLSGSERNFNTCKPKDLIGIPWLLAFALRDEVGFYLRQDIIWCLSGGAYVYARTKKGVMPVMIKDLVRLNPSTVQLWNGEKWTNVLGWGKSNDTSEKIELVLRSGERIGCTGNHVWPTHRGNVKALELNTGDIIQTCTLAENPKSYTPAYLTDNMLWLIGVYLAEGSKNGNALQISGHIDEMFRVEKIKSICTHYGGTCTYSIDGNNLYIRIYGKVIHAIINQYIRGNTAIDKGLSNAVWNLNNNGIQSIISGYLHGDGHYEEKNKRYRLGFCRNYNLEMDLRTAAARLGASITLKPVVATNQTGKFPAFQGEWRWQVSAHFNNKNRSEIIEIRKSRARNFWDISVEDEPHLFALASGVLTHNCKPNPMPESVTDRCTKAHEYLFLLSKKKNYFYDADAIKTEATNPEDDARRINNQDSKNKSAPTEIRNGLRPRAAGNKSHKVYAYAESETEEHRTKEGLMDIADAAFATANKRSVWDITSTPYKGIHYAVMPFEMATLTIQAGTSEYGCCAQCGKQYTRITKKKLVPTKKASYNTKIDNRDLIADANDQGSNRVKDGHKPGWINETTTTGWQKACKCATDTIKPAVVLDPFGGSGTTAEAANKLGRDSILIDLKKEYVLQDQQLRLHSSMGIFNDNKIIEIE